ncbi:hypothetical protein DL765_001446 [Monosporascus sp. GIB2]|nr:hypothetical protein DL765_001446 [Monosporascus sp. GIB2]
MTQVKLYRKDGACSFAPHALLRHLSIPFQDVPMRAGEDGYEAADGSFTHTEYLSINPTGYVPALAVDGEIVTEMPAVLTMIAHLAPDRERGLKLLGETSLEKSMVIHWLAWLSGTLHSLGFGGYWRPYRFVEDNAECYGAVKEKAMKVIKAGFERIDERLKGKTYALGDKPTVVDFNLYFFWRWGYEVGIPMEKEYHNFEKVLRKVEELDGLRKAVEEEGLSLYFESQN